MKDNSNGIGRPQTTTFVTLTIFVLAVVVKTERPAILQCQKRFSYDANSRMRED
jgi:hypothetical protein